MKEQYKSREVGIEARGIRSPRAHAGMQACSLLKDCTIMGLYICAKERISAEHFHRALKTKKYKGKAEYIFTFTNL